MPKTVHVVPARVSSANVKALVQKLAAAQKKALLSSSSITTARPNLKALAQKLAAAKKRPWKLVVPHHGRTAVSVHLTKQAAIDRAHQIARNVVVHGRNGQILEKSQAESRLGEAALRRAVRKILAKK